MNIPKEDDGLIVSLQSVRTIHTRFTSCVHDGGSVEAEEGVCGVDNLFVLDAGGESGVRHAQALGLGGDLNETRVDGEGLFVEAGWRMEAGSDCYFSAWTDGNLALAEVDVGELGGEVDGGDSQNAVLITTRRSVAALRSHMQGLYRVNSGYSARGDVSKLVRRSLRRCVLDSEFLAANRYYISYSSEK